MSISHGQIKRLKSDTDPGKSITPDNRGKSSVNKKIAPQKSKTFVKIRSWRILNFGNDYAQRIVEIASKYDDFEPYVQTS